MAALAAAATVVTGTIDTLAKNKIYKAEAEKLNLEARLAGLDSTQQYLLAQRLNKATSDNQRFAILKQAASEVDVEIVKSAGQIRQEGVKAQATNSIVTAIIIGSAVILLIVAFNVIYKRK